MSLAPFLWLANPLWIRGRDDTWRRDRDVLVRGRLGAPEAAEGVLWPCANCHVCLFGTGEVSWRNPTPMAALSRRCTKDFKIHICIYF